VAFVETDASEERVASIIRVKRISELGRAFAVHTTATRRRISEQNILNCYHREILSQKMAFFERRLKWPSSRLREAHEAALGGKRGMHKLRNL
jgi:hypothetical protein